MLLIHVPFVVAILQPSVETFQEEFIDTAVTKTCNHVTNLHEAISESKYVNSFKSTFLPITVAASS